MITDLRLLKFLEGRLPISESDELEKLISTHPDLQQRLAELKVRSQQVGRPAWQRILLDRNSRNGSRVRYTTLLPALLLLVLILFLAEQWYSKPGEKSTFTFVQGNGTALDILYNARQGWRYLDAGFQLGDSLLVSTKQGEPFEAEVYALFPGIATPVALKLWKGQVEKGDSKDRVFPSQHPEAPGENPSGIMVIYSKSPFSELSPEDVVALMVHPEGQGPRWQEFHWQIFALAKRGQNL